MLQEYYKVVFQDKDTGRLRDERMSATCISAVAQYAVEQVRPTNERVLSIEYDDQP